MFGDLGNTRTALAMDAMVNVNDPGWRKGHREYRGERI